jgi:hypothetical protein
MNYYRANINIYKNFEGVIPSRNLKMYVIVICFVVPIDWDGPQIPIPPPREFLKLTYIHRNSSNLHTSTLKMEAEYTSETCISTRCTHPRTELTSVNHCESLKSITVVLFNLFILMGLLIIFVNWKHNVNNYFIKYEFRFYFACDRGRIWRSRRFITVFTKASHWTLSAESYSALIQFLQDLF